VNRVTSPFTAIVDGQSTGLAGCKSMRCPRRADCIRADGQLTHSVDFRVTGSCSYFIPREEEKT
jgi:hypothetical protein